MWRKTVLLLALGVLTSSCASIHKEAEANEDVVIEDQQTDSMFRVTRDQDGFYRANLHLYGEGNIHDEFWARVENFCKGNAVRLSDAGVCSLIPQPNSNTFVGHCKSERFRCGTS